MPANHVWLTTFTADLIRQWQDEGILDLIDGCNRQLLESSIERVLVSNKDLLAHLAVLIRLLPKDRSFKVNDFGSELRSTILREGLTSLTSEQMANLVVNPMLLLYFSSEIEKTAPLHWSNVMEREAVPQFGKKCKKFCL